ncbi:MAG: sulfite exporter TauE/SafE family protein, partial [Desulfobacterales bacterium]|nr:sulfite exporter TauE/SafE family protein [Desulfobacterales bacterium]
MTPFVLCIVIFLSSFILTMVGLGGGLIFSPLFVILGYPLSTAVAVSLFLNGIAALSASITYFRSKMVDVQTGLPLIISSTLAAPLGALLTHRIDVRLFTVVLAVVIILAAGRMIFSKKPAAQNGVPASTARRVIGGGLIGIFIGTMAGLLGIGGGVFIVPLLIYLLRLPTKIAAATSMFIVVFSSFSGFIAHASVAALDWKFVGIAALFSFV